MPLRPDPDQKTATYRVGVVLGLYDDTTLLEVDLAEVMLVGAFAVETRGIDLREEVSEYAWTRR